MGRENPLLLLSYRMHEPIFLPKGDDGQCKLEIPIYFVIDKYQAIWKEIIGFAFNLVDATVGNLVTLKTRSFEIKELPQGAITFKVATKLDRGLNFSILNKQHRECAEELCQIFMDADKIDRFVSTCAFARDRVNPQMFMYCMQICMLHRPDCKHIPVPKLWEVFPDKFFDSALINKCKDEANIVPPGQRKVVQIPTDFTANRNEPEQKMAYWREDIGINLHHWHWHLVYPAYGRKEFVEKPRRGELNYYMHHQIMARYNTERLCNKMARTRTMDLREPIAEGYFPKLSEANSGRNWPSRPANMKISDVNRPKNETVISLAQMDMYRKNILEAIDTMTVIDKDNRRIELDEHDGIDILVNLMEASSISINKDRYGDYHNMGHLMMAYIHDPDYRFLEENGPMGDQGTAMRDPVFYRWHATVDEIFHLFKDKLPSYSANKLTFNGVYVKSASIIDLSGDTAMNNTITTHWVDSDINLTRGLAFARRGSVLARVQHLDHKAFKYQFIVDNRNATPVTATVRIFIAPKYDENGKPLSQNDQRMHMIEMDKKILTLPKGEHPVEIYSYDSSVTVPWETTFKETDVNGELIVDPDSRQFNGDQLCGCGWPLHMLVPKGSQEGFNMDLFVMFSNYEEDRVRLPNQPNSSSCEMGVSYCGLRNQPWPEVQSMGYPFDRVARPGVKTMNDFLTHNMLIQPITIRFNGKAPKLQSTKPKDSQKTPHQLQPNKCAPFDLTCKIVPGNGGILGKVPGNGGILGTAPGNGGILGKVPGNGGILSFP